MSQQQQAARLISLLDEIACEGAPATSAERSSCGELMELSAGPMLEVSTALRTTHGGRGSAKGVLCGVPERPGRDVATGCCIRDRLSILSPSRLFALLRASSCLFAFLLACLRPFVACLASCSRACAWSLACSSALALVPPCPRSPALVLVAAVGFPPAVSLLPRPFVAVGGRAAL